MLWYYLSVTRSCWLNSILFCSAPSIGRKIVIDPRTSSANLFNKLHSSWTPLVDLLNCLFLVSIAVADMRRRRQTLIPSLP